MHYIGIAIALSGAVLLCLAAVGLFLLKDALSRQHAATKAGTLALGLIIVGAAVMANTAEWYGRALLLILTLFVTLPVASHMLARAAVKEQNLLSSRAK
jgi:multicomponent Na+:H+ antiporter subunit G